MKVSIITSCYNRCSVVRKAIESVLAQDYPDIEYIVVDGNSTDGSMEIINEYKDKINRIICESDNGMYEAINKGIKAATGDIVGLLHSDDFFYDQHTISEVVKTFENNKVDMVYGNGLYVNEKDTKCIVRKWISGKYKRKAIKWGWLPLHTTVYMKRDCFKKVGMYDEDYQIAADTDFLVRCLFIENLNVYYLNRYIVKMRMGGLSTNPKQCKRKWSEDIKLYKTNGIPPYPALAGKILMKIPQYIKAKML